MTQETLKKANELLLRLKVCQKNLDRIKYTQDENVLTRKGSFKCLGMDYSVEVPENLFRIIGKLIQTEYTQEISELQKELDEL